MYKRKKKFLKNLPEDIWKNDLMTAVQSVGIHVQKPKCTHRVFLESSFSYFYEWAMSMSQSFGFSCLKRRPFVLYQPGHRGLSICSSKYSKVGDWLLPSHLYDWDLVQCLKLFQYRLRSWYRVCQLSTARKHSPSFWPIFNSFFSILTPQRALLSKYTFCHFIVVWILAGNLLCLKIISV